MGVIDLSSFSVSLELLKVISEIDEFKGAWQFWGRLNPERLNFLKTVATIESIGSSTRIEGAKLSDKEIQQLLMEIEPHSFRTRDEQEVAGYAYTSEKIHQHFNEMPITENTIKQLHSWLLQYSDKDEGHRGNYKKIPIRIEAFNENGESAGVIFEATSPFETPNKMRDLIQWFNIVIEEGSVHVLIAIGVFIVIFLAIHPFQDGNGRLSRLLTTLLMLKCNYSYVPYSSMESIIEVNKEAYYSALQATQNSWQKNQADWTPWLNFFLSCIQKQKKHLEIKLVETAKISSRLTAIQTKILDCLKLHNSLVISEIALLTSINRNTLKKNLDTLLKGNFIQRQGLGKATRYTWYRD